MNHLWLEAKSRFSDPRPENSIQEKQLLEESLTSCRPQPEHAQEAASSSEDELLRTLAYQLRTPLTAMLGWAQLLRSHELDEETIARALETIERNAKIQVLLIEKLLEKPCEPKR
ncbi:histidine kinase dimerization/phospho-acceptor domain-containing protein [Leptolyngbya sp. FACHB-261]|uniref:histidine kinase dimerization/phospho-acceptor domain-containing protein n=1 Tax=Leptolyngbya sp. FACHB-261 TaxID=2692806 RepID=UPI0016879D20|nr:histidine kinase dimerization/phospho-acceptor domain-containing protein [Leptolyngbya sp. FACHB-261]MBD2104895.1 hypothetical protein [Leptolyngbya sp. FACHB-261]